LVKEKPDVVIDVIDTTSLERQLYLAVQLIELGVKLVLAFNMSDMARKAGFEFDIPLLSNLLGVPIVQTVGSKGEGLDELMEIALRVAKGEIETTSKPLSYGRELDNETAKIAAKTAETGADRALGVSSRWLAIKLLEGDERVKSNLEKIGKLTDELKSSVQSSNNRLSLLYRDSTDILIAEARYGIISGACSEAVRHTVERRHSFSDNLDTVLLSPVLGIPIFLLAMFAVFFITFRLGEPLTALLERFFGFLAVGVANFDFGGNDEVLKSLLADGVIGGVGAVLVFLPNILLLFLGIAALEDTGYMARAAFIMDRVMHRIGLHGKSFIPMLIGFGCTIPAIMGTRILENRRDRLVLILVLPLFSCSARLPIYALIIPAFFPQHLQGPMLWLMYVIGILLAVGLTKFLRGTLFKGESTPFVMELPPYRIPTLKGLLIHAWDRGYQYFKKAGTVILAFSIILWFVSSYPELPESKITQFDEQMKSAELAFENQTVQFLSEITPNFEMQNRTTLFMNYAESTEETENDPVLETALKIEDLRDDFERIIEREKFTEGTLEFIALKYDFERNLDELRKTDPESFDLAIYFTDNILSPHVSYKDKALNSFAEQKLTHSAMGRIAHFISPVLKPMGFDWKIGSALIGATAAKEVFVAQMGIVFSVGETDELSKPLRKILQRNYTPLIGFCIMLFCLIGLPCIATFAVTRVETGSWFWAFVQHGGLTLLAWIVTTIVFQLGSAIGWGTT
ncbi:MAG TPA: ferrous iron transport protein B, partial [Firmicutes bacterium]|nr:ferrous iron transport protein B [Bacillota bacterium]